MIEETQRIIQHEESPKEQGFKEVQEYEEPIRESIREPMKSITKESTNRMNYFFTELLVCSLLIWSLLFLKDSSYGNSIIDGISHVLSQNINIEPIESTINELSKAVRQIL